ncbi:putative serine/threonine-protein kinase [Cornus florida]|uniref:putative serine/threonine-protein kinase n=1 Tax=Cornus florida TaxID=4283 RepID=UPI0028A0B7EA|nr:putative serine/threonine-protein kinase [Cornus florida]
MKFSFLCSKCFFSSSAIHFDKTREESICRSIDAFSYNELKVATNGFRSSNKIGEGGFGSVYKGVLQDGTAVAVKVLSVESKQGDNEFMSEMASMSNITHENLVKLHGGCINRACRMLVYDYMENNSLAQTLLGGEEKRVQFSWETRHKISLGIARGLAYIHEDIKPHVVHRDIKASNILLDQNFSAKISDFGLSKFFPDNITHISTRVAGTLGYLAPEYAISGHLTRKSDVYSFGVLLLEIVTGRSAIDFDVELGEHYLVEKAWDMYKSNKLEQLVDPMLKGDFSAVEAVRFLKVGLLCVQEITGLRPKMSAALKIMRDEININGLQISQPGLITNMMDVKIGSRCTSESITTTASSRSPPSFTAARSPQLYHSKNYNQKLAR